MQFITYAHVNLLKTYTSITPLWVFNHRFHSSSVATPTLENVMSMRSRNRV